MFQKYTRLFESEFNSTFVALSNTMNSSAFSIEKQYTHIINYLDNSTVYLNGLDDQIVKLNKLVTVEKN